MSLGSKVRPRTFECVAMRNAVLFIFMSILHSSRAYLKLLLTHNNSTHVEVG